MGVGWQGGVDYKEGGLYLIQPFSIYKNNADYKVNNHNYKIFFLTTTAVTVSEDIDFPTYYLNFVGFNNLKSQSYDISLLYGRLVGKKFKL